jgi:hypothetical protein
MPVLIHDVGESTNSTVSVYIPNGRHDYMLLAFSTAWNEDYSSGGSGIPTRSAPSGGGGTWNLTTGVYASLAYVAGEGPDYINTVIYAWYSYPTSRGTVVLNSGGAGNDDGYRTIVYSLSNAKYFDHDSIQDNADGIAWYNALMSKQGSSPFIGVSSIIKGSQLGNLGAKDGTEIDEFGGTLIKDGNYEYTYASHNRHRRYRSVSTGGYWEPSGLYNAGRCASIMVSVDTVECP